MKIIKTASYKRAQVGGFLAGPEAAPTNNSPDASGLEDAAPTANDPNAVAPNMQADAQLGVGENITTAISAFLSQSGSTPQVSVDISQSDQGPDRFPTSTSGVYWSGRPPAQIRWQGVLTNRTPQMVTYTIR